MMKLYHLTSNLYEDGFSDWLSFKHKIMNSGIDADSSVSGDVDANHGMVTCHKLQIKFPIG